MKKILFLLIGLSISVLGLSQKISNIDLDEIKEETLDSNSRYSYQKLRSKAIQLDGMTKKEYRHLYYGTAFQEDYSPYTMFSINGTIDDLIDEEEFQQAIDIARKEWQSVPARLGHLDRLIYCFKELHERDSVEAYQDMFYGILKAILSSGDGRSIETAFVVLGVPHEYTLVRVLGLRSLGQALIHSDEGPIDKLSIDKKGQKRVKGQKKIKALYFNVSLPLNSLASMLKDTEEGQENEGDDGD